MTERFLLFAAWGFTSTIVWGMVLSDAYGAYKVFGDKRSKRELLRDGALFITAFGSTLAVLGVLFGEQGTTWRGIALAAALGAFLGAGVVRLSLRRGTHE